MVTLNREDPWYWASLLVADLDIVGVGDWWGMGGDGGGWQACP